MEYSAERIAELLFIPNHINTEYGGTTYDFRFYSANLGRREAVAILNDHIRGRFSETESEEMILMMSFYWKFRDSPALGTKLSERVIRIGERKFDIRSLGTPYRYKDSGRKVKEYITFSRHRYPSGIVEGWDRYKYFVDNITKDEIIQEYNPDMAERFQSAIYYPLLGDNEINEDEFNDYANSIYQKLLELKEIESKYWSEKTEGERKEALKGGGLESKQKLQREFTSAFSEDIKNPLFKRLFYELECLFMCFWEEIFAKVYMFLSPSLTSVERKAYLLAYMRQEYLGYQIPLFEPILEEFQRILNQTSTDEILYGLLFCEDKSESDLINEKYREQFEGFLKFYPKWVEITRIDDLNARDLRVIDDDDLISRSLTVKSKDKEFNYFFHSLNDEVRPGTDEPITFQDILADIVLENSRNHEKMKHIISTKLTIKQQEVINLILGSEGNIIQEEIAEQLGITQEAVSQRLENAKKIIKENYKPTL